MSIVLVGYCNGSKDVQTAFVFGRSFEDKSIKLFDGKNWVGVEVRVDERFINIRSVDYINKHGVEIDIKFVDSTVVGSFFTGLNPYSSGSSGPLEPALLEAAVEFFRG